MAATAPYPLRCLVCNRDLDTYQTLNHTVDEHIKSLIVTNTNNKEKSKVLLVNVQCEPDNINLPIGRLIVLMNSETPLVQLHAFFKSIWLGCSCPKPHEACFVQDGKEYHYSIAASSNKKSSSLKKLLQDADDRHQENDDDEGEEDDDDDLSVSDFSDDEHNEQVSMQKKTIGDLLFGSKDQCNPDEAGQKDWCEYNFDMENTSCIGLCCVKMFEGKKIAGQQQQQQQQTSSTNISLPQFADNILVLVRNYRDVKTQILCETAKNSPRVGMCSSLKKLDFGSQGTIRLISGGNSSSDPTKMEFLSSQAAATKPKPKQNQQSSKAAKAAPRGNLGGKKRG